MSLAIRPSHNCLGKTVTRKRVTVYTLVVTSIATTILSATVGCGGTAGTSRPTNVIEPSDLAPEHVAQDNTTLIIAHKSGPDYLDPALSYKASGWEPLWVCYTPLLTYKHVPGKDGTIPIPGLAEAIPEVSKDGRTYTFKLRKGLVYSDGTAVKASDFRHTIFRMLRLASQGAANFEGIEGVSAVLEENGKPEGDRKLNGVSGIVVDDATGVIKVTLVKPNVMFPYVMAMPFGGLVPSSTPIKNLTTAPPPGVGAFKITKHDPRREFILERNERFEVPGLPTAQVDKIVCKIIDNDTQMTQDVMAGRLDYMFEPPAVALRKRVRDKCEDRFKEHITPSTHFFFMNSTVAPFNDVRVRRAVHLAIDREKIASLYGGLFEPGKTFIPPGLPGHAPDAKASKPKLLQAHKLLKEAGATGTEVVVFGTRDDPGKAVCEYLTGVLNELGLKARFQAENTDQYYVVVGNKRKMEKTPFIGYNTWFMDYPHPGNFFFLVNGRTIQDEGNQNPGMVNDEKINKEYDRLIALAEPNEKAWAALDRYLVDEMTYVVPFGSVKYTTFLSSRMDSGAAYYHLIYQNDYTSFRVKK